MRAKIHTLFWWIFTKNNIVIMQRKVFYLVTAGVVDLIAKDEHADEHKHDDSEILEVSLDEKSSEIRVSAMLISGRWTCGCVVCIDESHFSKIWWWNFSRRSFKQPNTKCKIWSRVSKKCRNRLCQNELQNSVPYCENFLFSFFLIRTIHFGYLRRDFKSVISCHPPIVGHTVGNKKKWEIRKDNFLRRIHFFCEK